METKKGLTGKEKFAYGIGAVGKDMVYMLSASYVLYYFQDILKTSAIAMGIILLVARVFDAFNDPIMGVVVAKTKTRWGKFRPWLMIGTITNAVVLFLMFAAPPTLDGKGLIAYAAVTYILWGVTYTMMDIPYWSMIPAFTQSGKEREGLSALGRSCAGVGSALVTVLTVMAVTAIGTSLTAKSTSNITKQFSTADTKINTFVIELDSDGNPTSNVTEYAADKQDVSVAIVGSEKAFEDVYSFNNSNTKYEFTANGITADSSKVEFVKDSEASGEAGLVFYVDHEAYQKITASDSIKADLTMNSTLEVERVGFKYFSLIIGILFIHDYSYYDRALQHSDIYHVKPFDLLLQVRSRRLQLAGQLHAVQHLCGCDADTCDDDPFPAPSKSIRHDEDLLHRSVLCGRRLHHPSRAVASRNKERISFLRTRILHHGRGRYPQCNLHDLPRQYMRLR